MHYHAVHARSCIIVHDHALLSILAEQTNAARAAYATDFEEVFSYRKGAQTFKMVSEKAIARRFQQLNGKKPY